MLKKVLPLFLIFLINPAISFAETNIYVSEPKSISLYSFNEQTSDIQLKKTYSFNDNILYTAVSPDKKHFYVTTDKKNPKLMLWDIDFNGNLKNVKIYNLDNEYNYINFSSDNKTLLAFHEYYLSKEVQPNKKDFYSYVDFYNIKSGKIDKKISTYSKNQLIYNKNKEMFFYNSDRNIYLDNVVISYAKEKNDISISKEFEEKSYNYSENSKSKNGKYIYFYNDNASIQQMKVLKNGNLEKEYQTPLLDDKFDYHNISSNKIYKRFSIINEVVSENFLYLADKENNCILIFSLDPQTGNPKLINIKHINEKPITLNIIDNKFLIVGTQSNKINIFSIKNEQLKLIKEKNINIKNNIDNQISIITFKKEK